MKLAGHCSMFVRVTPSGDGERTNFLNSRHYFDFCGGEVNELRHLSFE
ncbi:hypothetical protein [Alkalihalobacillus pseudalcaliphilus]|nr:hypothetical protein [Alkalihalobacillus pseudalcaliphilus]